MSQVNSLKIQMKTKKNNTRISNNNKSNCNLNEKSSTTTTTVAEEHTYKCLNHNPLITNPNLNLNSWCSWVQSTWIKRKLHATRFWAWIRVTTDCWLLTKRQVQARHKFKLLLTCFSLSSYVCLGYFILLCCLFLATKATHTHRTTTIVNNTVNVVVVTFVNWQNGYLNCPDSGSNISSSCNCNNQVTTL